VKFRPSWRVGLCTRHTALGHTTTTPPPLPLDATARNPSVICVFSLVLEVVLIGAGPTRRYGAWMTTLAIFEIARMISSPRRLEGRSSQERERKGLRLPLSPTADPSVQDILAFGPWSVVVGAQRTHTPPVTEGHGHGDTTTTLSNRCDAFVCISKH